MSSSDLPCVEVLFTSNREVVFSNETSLSIPPTIKDKIIKLIYDHYNNFTMGTKTQQTILFFPSVQYKKYKIVLTYDQNLWDADIVRMLEEQLVELNDSDRFEMEKSLRNYLNKRSDLLKSNLGDYIRVVANKDFEIIGPNHPSHQETYKVPDSFIFKIGNELGMDEDRFYINIPTGTYFEFQITGGGILRNKLLVSINIQKIDETYLNIDNALVDTGATSTVFDTQILTDVGYYDKSLACVMHGIGKTSVRKLSSLAVEFFGHRVDVIEPRFTSLSQSGITALIGMDLIQYVKWSIDGGDVVV